ncbi:GLPGLI family protein [Flavobacterium muglaense]|uniref:GLPGLI family protein n=1 Tax=Flavobacterium muglaense TaxID=2764716 RepID=A0A923N2S3_9FLAO|nr:GLPGLI family protein [Flavobacterium muglaense]MBC5839764.1 GLPGLI family protein [Flavobacterium muglaense]MBC5846291.1 GLPGLI family protein [Flavobacterium muglaense]
MKTTILLLFAFIGSIAQTNTKYASLIEYQFTTTLGGKIYKENTTLKCTNSQAIFQTFSQKEGDSSMDKDNETTVHINVKNKDESYILDIAKKTLNFTDFIDEKAYKINETIPVMKWVLSTKKEDVKKINNFICNKATLNFRGRNYIAWYTYKVPLSFGPWKFNGLPGLILEIYDSQNTYHWTATKIILPLKEKIDFNVIQKLKANEITLNQYVDKIEKAHKSRSDIMLKRLPRGVTLESSTSENYSIELKYD